MAHDNVVRVYDKRRNLLAEFDGNAEGLTPEAQRNLMVAPTVHRETNGPSTLTFQMLVNCEKWQQIKDPENIYVLNDHEYTALNDGAYEYGGEEGIRTVNVTLCETWYLLDKRYVQAYNCGIYSYAKATFDGYVSDGAKFTIRAADCSNPSNTISPALAWAQVKLWRPVDDDGNSLTFGVIKSEGYEPKNWEDAPPAVAFSSFTVSGNTASVIVTARAKTQATETFEYSGASYHVGVSPAPASVASVYVNTTTTEEIPDDNPDDFIESYTRYTTSTKETGFTYSGGTVTINYTPAANETINSVIVNYSYSDLGNISPGATCTFAYGAEAIDEHTFVILPKTDKKYKLTVNGVEYDDSEVKDARGVIMPRGSGGYAMWAALRDTGWSLGVCDVIAKGFDASIDYGCFNVESDMRDVLYNIQYIQELYGGILDFDSVNKVVNYRGENSEDYESYEDGFNDWTGYEFREGKNLTEVPQITVDNEIITRAFLLGYGNLNVKKVNGGKTYVEDFSYTDALYEGYLEQPLIYDTRDDGGMNMLLYWGKKELAKKCKPRVKITASVTDIRTVEGYEHEVFDLNDVVRLYYKDSDTGIETYEEKRITTWEYNAFAMWDCTVEIGDKTQNLSEVFKLIYNKAIQQSPSANASGQFSADDIILDIPNWGDIEFEWDSSGGYGSGGYGYGGFGYGSMSDYLSLIVEKQTENSDAIADLILEATELYARADLFAQYQKVTEDMISDTYAGLTVYADEMGAALELLAEGYFTQLNDDLSTLETHTQAGFQAQATQNEAFTKQFSQVDSTIRGIEGNITSQSKSIASLETRATATEASVKANASLETTHYNELTKSIASVSSAQASFEATVKRDYATTSQLSSYITKDAAGNLISQSEASVKTWANGQFASASIEATVNNHGSALSVTSSGTRLTVSGGSYSTYFNISSTAVNLLASSTITISCPGMTLSPNGFTLGSQTATWQTKTISGTTIRYLGNL